MHLWILWLFTLLLMQIFFCVEPVSNVTDAFNMLARGEFGHGTKTLLPGELLEGKICFVPELS